MMVFVPGTKPLLRAESDTRVVLVGGAPLGGQRHAWCNFVFSFRESIEQAKQDWKEGRFPPVVGNDVVHSSSRFLRIVAARLGSAPRSLHTYLSVVPAASAREEE